MVEGGKTLSNLCCSSCGITIAASIAIELPLTMIQVSETSHLKERVVSVRICPSCGTTMLRLVE